MAVQIAHASIDENKGIKNGKAGDQTGKEVCTRDWYLYKGGWDYVLRCKNPEMANNIAEIAKAGAANPNIGYDQNQRNTLWTQFNKVGSISKITTPCETDCSAFTTCCILAAAQSLNINLNFNYGSNAPCTSNMATRFMPTGYFDKLTDAMYLQSSDYLRKGDIIVKSGHHVVMVISDGAKVNKPISDSGDVIKTRSALNPYKEPSATQKKGDKGEGVFWVQWELRNIYGYSIAVDGDFGKNTDTAVRDYQKKKALEVDGKVGPATRKSLKSI